MLDVNLKKIKPYGDRLDDGAVQLSFTLPVKASPEAREAAKLLVEKMHLDGVSVAVMEPVGDDFSFFVVYGRTAESIDITRIKVPRLDVPHMGYQELTELMDRVITDPIVVVGACTGHDAHTVGIDAILNMKGYAGDYGLERYAKFKVHNLRSQLSNEELIERALALKADALLISQVVTQRDSHIKNLKNLRELLSKDSRLPKHLTAIIGGPRIDHALALKLGFDAGFGHGTMPSQVASFIVMEYCARRGIPLEAPAAPAAPATVDEAMLDEETMEESFTPLSYKQPARGQIRQEASSQGSTLLKYRRPRRGRRGGKGRKRKPAKA